MLVKEEKLPNAPEAVAPARRPPPLRTTPAGGPLLILILGHVIFYSIIIL